MRSTEVLVALLAAAAMGLTACKTASPTSLEGNGDANGVNGGAQGSGNGISSNVTFAPDAVDALSARKVDYGEALRTASLKLVQALPTLAQIKNVAGAADQKAAYEQEIDGMLADPRFQERMIKWWQDVMRVGGGAANGAPSRDTAPTFAARVVAEEQPFSELFTAASNTCPTYDYKAHAFADGDCKSGAPAVSGVLTDPGVMHQFYGDMAFRRVRWVQEVFVCTKFPAEYAQVPVHMGSADYTSPWPFKSVATAPINFQDTSSVICANCHTTINHMAPLFAQFDNKGAWQSTIQVMTPPRPPSPPSSRTGSSPARPLTGATACPPPTWWPWARPSPPIPTWPSASSPGCGTSPCPRATS